jgi:hypothetical protein
MRIAPGYVLPDNRSNFKVSRCLFERGFEKRRNTAHRKSLTEFVGVLELPTLTGYSVRLATLLPEVL